MSNNPNQVLFSYVSSVFLKGVFKTISAGVWMYWVVPNAPIGDAPNNQIFLDGVAPISRIINALGKDTKIGFRKTRKDSELNFRNVHMLTCNIPSIFEPSMKNEKTYLYDFLKDNYKDQFVTKKLSVFGVQLRPEISLKNHRGNIFRTIADGASQIARQLVNSPLDIEQYSNDIKKVSHYMSSSGLREPTSAEISLIQSWFTLQKAQNVPALICDSHIHMNLDPSAINLIKSQVDGIKNKCGDMKIPNSYTCTLASINSLDVDGLKLYDENSLWLKELLDSGALAISIRSKIEPPVVTRQELKNNAKKFELNNLQRLNDNKKIIAEEDELEHRMKEIEETYALSNIGATLHDTSIIVAMEGIFERADDILPYAKCEFATLTYSQHQAWQEMSVGSPILINPHRLEIPEHTLAFSGINSQERMPNADKGVLLGFSVDDRTPIYINPHDSSENDLEPFTIIIGKTGSGKSVTLNSLTYQAALYPSLSDYTSPVVSIEYGKATDLIGDDVLSLSDLKRVDGIFDPIKCFADPGSAASIATNMLSSIFGLTDEESIDLIAGITHGVKNGATCTGEALKIALEASQLGSSTFNIDISLIKKIMKLHANEPLLSTIIGTKSDTTTLSIKQGLTLINSGNVNIPLPQEGAQKTTIIERVGLWVMRMTVLSVFNALRGRGGVIALDEAHQFVMGDTKDLIALTGRLARSEGVWFIMASQRAQEFENSCIWDYVNKLILLPSERDQVELALKHFKYEKMDRVIYRLSANRTVGDQNRPNFNSAFALKDENGTVLRSSTPFYIDKGGIGLFVENVLPKNLLSKIETTRKKVKLFEDEK
jgi:hypothetical protein